MPKDFEESLGGQNTFSGGARGRDSGPKSLGDEATIGGGGGPDDGSGLDDGMEVVDLAARYKTEGVLGKGGMGEVLLATDTRLGRKVAIKRMHSDAAKSRTAVSRFLTEAKSIAALNHLNIVQIHDYGRAADGPFLILEYVDGDSLLSKCKTGAIPLTEAVDLTCQLCDGLAMAHDANIIHRDIKPANVLMTKSGIPKLSDFGLARDEAADSGLSVAGAVLGTLDFMPPEQRKDAALTDGRSDLWSLAATLYQMVTGEPPHVINLDAVPQELRETLSRALKTKKEDRYQTARQFRDALKASLTPIGPDPASLTEGQCPSCGTKNEAGRKFCRKCAGSLEVTCLSCTSPILVWEEVCGSCGGRQKELAELRRQQMDQQRIEAESRLSDGYFKRAIAIAQPILDETDGRLQHLKAWAQSFLAEVEDRQRTLGEEAAARFLEAKTHVAAKDYESAAQALSHLKAGMVTPEMVQLRAEVDARLQEITDLKQLIRQRVEARELKGLLTQVNRILELQPGRRNFEDLRETLKKRDEKLNRTQAEALENAGRLISEHRDKECVDFLEKLPADVRSPEIADLQEKALLRYQRCEKLREQIESRQKNKQYTDLLDMVLEFLKLQPKHKEMQTLRQQLEDRKKKLADQLSGLLKKVEQFRLNAKFDDALELLNRIPGDIWQEEYSLIVDEIQMLSESRVKSLSQLTDEDDPVRLQKALHDARKYREQLTSAVINDAEFDVAVRTAKERIAERQATRRARLRFVAAAVVLVLVFCSSVYFSWAAQAKRAAAIAADVTRGELAMNAGDFAEAVSAYSEVIQQDATQGDAFIQRAIATLRANSQETAVAKVDLDRANALPHTEQQKLEAEQLLLCCEIEQASVRDDVTAAEVGLKSLSDSGAREEYLSRARTAYGNALLKRASSSIKQQQTSAALADIETAKQLHPAFPQLGAVEADAYVLRATQSLAAGSLEQASADFLLARQKNIKAAGLGSLAAQLAEELIVRCETAFDDAAYQDATAALTIVSEVDASSQALSGLKDRLGKVLVAEADKAIAAKQVNRAVGLAESIAQLSVLPAEQSRLLTAGAGLLFEQCEQQIRDKQLEPAVQSIVSIQALPVDESQKQQAMTALVSQLEPLLLPGLQSENPEVAAAAINTLPEETDYSAEFRKSLPALPASTRALLPESVLRSIAPTWINDGLIAYFEFNNSLVDAGPYNLQLAEGDMAFDQDRFGIASRSLLCDGTSTNYSTSFPYLDGNSPRTFSFWVRTLKTSQQDFIYIYSSDQTPGSAWQCSTSWEIAGVTASTGNSALTYSADIFDGKWHHLIWTLPTLDNARTSDISIYVDGVLASRPSRITDKLVNEAALVNTTVGRLGIGGKNVNGQLDDLRIYNRALSADEVKALYDYESQAPADAVDYAPRLDDSLTTYVEESLKLTLDLRKDAAKPNFSENAQIYVEPGGLTYWGPSRLRNWAIVEYRFDLPGPLVHVDEWKIGVNAWNAHENPNFDDDSKAILEASVDGKDWIELYRTESLKPKVDKRTDERINKSVFANVSTIYVRARLYATKDFNNHRIQYSQFLRTEPAKGDYPSIHITIKRKGPR